MKNSPKGWSRSPGSGIWCSRSFENLGTSELTWCHLGNLVSLTEHCDLLFVCEVDIKSHIINETPRGPFQPPCLCNLYAEYIMKNAGLDAAQAGIKIARRNINNLKYAGDTTLMAESEEEQKSILMKSERGEWKSWLKTQHSKNEDCVIQSHRFMENRWGNNRNSDRLYFLGSKITEDGDCSPEIERCLLLGRKAMTNIDSIIKKKKKRERHYFTNKGPSSESFGFSTSHVWMWELDYK